MLPAFMYVRVVRRVADENFRVAWHRLLARIPVDGCMKTRSEYVG